MRYIDADALLERMKRTPRYFDVKYDIEQMPTADVVPKSEADNLIKVIDNTTQQFLELHDLYQNEKREVERLENILNSYALQYGTVMDKHTVIEKERAEVAREIFEEIETLIGHTAFADCWSEGGFKSDITELKKKYTGGNDA